MYHVAAFKINGRAKQNYVKEFLSLLFSVISYVQYCRVYTYAYRLGSFFTKAGFVYQSRADPMFDRFHRSLVSKILKRDSGENVLVLYRISSPKDNSQNNIMNLNNKHVSAISNTRMMSKRNES